LGSRDITRAGIDPHFPVSLEFEYNQADDVVVVKAESPIDLTQDDDDETSDGDDTDNGETDHEPLPIIRDTEPSEYNDDEDTSDLFPVTSDGNGNIKNTGTGNSGTTSVPSTRQLRLDRVIFWLEDFDWMAQTKKTDIVGHCWASNLSAVSVFLQ